ncbi:flagellar hook-basal body complex protein, partial [Desulfobulbus sp. AH-315-M07]|nr:flagellar hook-basal body complex protein [Desulfobulbus sp. AH-315-M07]
MDSRNGGAAEVAPLREGPGGMSINRTINTGVSGITAETQAMGIIGDNVANVNTVGFKQSRGQFEDILGAQASAGGGVRMVRAQQIFTQGAIKNTGVPTDLALSGEGFFVVRGTVDGVTGEFFTRAGQFAVKADGTIVNSADLAVQGYRANATGTGFQSALSALQVSTRTLQPRATANLEFVANLDATSTTIPGGFDIADPVGSSNFSTSLTVFDPEGVGHSLDIYFVKGAAPGVWDVHVVANSTELNSPSPGPNAGTEIYTGPLQFDGLGNLIVGAQQTIPTVQFTNPSGIPNPQSLDLEFSGMTLFGGDSSISFQTQDGFGAGNLTGLNITSDGVVAGVYSNGEQVAVGQIAVAKFQANYALDRAGHNLWIKTRDSG